MAQHVVQQRSRRMIPREVRQCAKAYPVRTPDVDLRQSRRQVQLEGCTYQMVEHLGGEALVIETGQAISVNRSVGGMLFMMSHAPEADRYLEVHTHPVVGRRTAYLMQVRWTKPVRNGANGGLVLVGCRRMFGPYQYFQM